MQPPAECRATFTTGGYEDVARIRAQQVLTGQKMDW